MFLLFLLSYNSLLESKFLYKDCDSSISTNWLKKLLNHILKDHVFFFLTNKNFNCIAAGWVDSDVVVELEKRREKNQQWEKNRRFCCKVAIICRHLCLTGWARFASGSRLSIHLSTALFLISQAIEVFLTSSWVNRRTNFRETD